MGISNVASNLQPGVCTSTTRPTTPYEGQSIYETDTDRIYIWKGSSWVEVPSGPPQVRQALQAQTTQILVNTTTWTDVVSLSITTQRANATLICHFSGDCNANDAASWKRIGWFLDGTLQHYVISATADIYYQEVVGLSTILTGISLGAHTIAVKAQQGSMSSTFAEEGGQHKNTLVVMELS